VLAAAVAMLPTAAVAADPTPSTTIAVNVTTPNFPTPYQSAVIGLAFTAVVTVAARVTQRTSNTMMYMVLASIVLTGVFLAASDRIYAQFDQTLSQRLVALQQTGR
jgi:hypothetical protein